MSHAHDHDPTVPRGALIGTAALLLGTLAATGAVSWGLIPHAAAPEASRAAQNVMPVQERALVFADREDGAVVISDARSGATVSVIDFGQGGFVRATMRRLARERAAQGIGAEPPFVLVRWGNGALSLRDPETGGTAEIYGFGPDHVRVFADMLESPAA
jgi:putative photosynthetic complex assembly protein